MSVRLGPALLCLLLVLIFPPAGLGEPTVPIFVSGQDRPYEALSGGRSRLITVRGPGELRLVSRVRFRPEDDPAQSYALLLRVDGGPVQELSYEQVQRSRTAMFRDGTLGVPGRLMDHRLKLRRGYHNIEIQLAPGSPPVFFRHLFKPGKTRRRSWVPITPLESAELVELVVRESLVAYYRNRPGQPFVLEVIGPTELRVFTRVENRPEMRGRIHYRLQFREQGQVINTFQLSSRRSEIATYFRDDTLVPGRAAEVVIPIPEGAHRLEVLSLDPDKSTLLARFMLPREHLSLTAD